MFWVKIGAEELPSLLKENADVVPIGLCLVVAAEMGQRWNWLAGRVCLGRPDAGLTSQCAGRAAPSRI